MSWQRMQAVILRTRMQILLWDYIDCVFAIHNIYKTPTHTPEVFTRVTFGLGDL